MMQTRLILLVIIFSCETYLPHRPVVSDRDAFCSKWLKWTRVYLFLDSRRRGIGSTAISPGTQPLSTSHGVFLSE